MLTINAEADAIPKQNISPNPLRLPIVIVIIPKQHTLLLTQLH